ncbi:MAG: hypothetical protein GWN71_00825 [Gammaproteobacteria bacterium]|nr:hypothetical protein [Gammaproteobacteria bacterium]
MRDPDRYWEHWKMIADLMARACLSLGVMVVAITGLLYPVAESAGYVV